MKLQAKITVKGTKPLLFNSFKEETLSPRASKSGTTGNDEDSWKKGVLMDDQRRLFVFNTYFLGAIKNGAKYIKVGKSNLSQKVVSALEIKEHKIFLSDRQAPEDSQLLRLETEKVYLDVRGVTNPATRGKNLRYRLACSPGWEISFIIEWDDYIISKEQMKMCLDNSGTYGGIGDGLKIGFGRYEVIEFKILS